MWRRKAPGARSLGCRSPLGLSRQKKVIQAAIERFEARLLLSATLPSNIPSTVFNILNYGASDTATSSETNTAAINAAIAAAAANTVAGVKGGIVEIPAAAQPWLAGPYLNSSNATVTITLASNVDLKIDAGATLQAIPESSYLSAGATSVSNFITSNNISNFEITGSGTIDGNGAGWWNAYNANSSIGRPRLVNLSNSSVFLIQGVTLQNAGMFNLNLSNCSNVTANGITISDPSTSPNTDGIDMSGSHYLIENCNISDGDDDISPKPESVACSDMTVENCMIGAGHGISIGGETNAGLNGFYVNNITFTNTTNGIRLKADRTNGGVVQNVYYSNITMNGVEYPILIDSYYNGSNNLPTNPSTDPGQTYVAGQTPLWENIIFANITSTDSASNSAAGVIYGLPEAPVTNLDFVNVQITAHSGLQINHARNIRFDSSSTVTASSGNDLYGSTGSGGYPNPYDATIVAAGFLDEDIGSPTVATGTSSALFNPDTAQWTLIGDGAGIAGSSDQFNAAFGSVIGDSTVQAQLKSLTTQGGSAVSEAGVMYRNSNSAGDAFAAVVQTSASQISFEYRTSSGGSIVIGGTASASVGSDYLQVVRSGSNFAGYYSTNGTNWTQIGSTVAISNIGTTAQAGLVVSAGSNGSLATAVFANVSSLPGPTVATAAAANPSPVTATSTALSVLGAEAGSDTGFIYFWQAGIPGSTPVVYSSEATNSAKNTTANFTKAGTYNFTALIVDPLGLSASSSVAVTVQQTPAAIAVSPSSSPVVPVGFSQQFSATATDQFGNSISSPSLNWSITGSGNTISGSGDATLGLMPGTFTVTASGGTAQANAGVIAENFAVPAGSTLNINLSAAGAVNLSASGNSITASQNGVQITLSGFTGVTVTDTGSGDVLNFNGPLALPFTFVNCSQSTVNVNSGTLTFTAVSGGSVNVGTLSVANGASAVITAATTSQITTLTLSGLSIGASGSLDVTNNEVLITYGSGTDPIASIAGMIGTGYANGAWDGPGIISSVAQSHASYGLGYADAADVGNPAGLAPGQIEILYTLLGDANLDGKVNGDDFVLMANNFNDYVTAGWDQGDFNYSNTVNGDDFTLLSANFNQAAQVAVAATTPVTAAVSAVVANSTSDVVITPASTTTTHHHKSDPSDKHRPR